MDHARNHCCDTCYPPNSECPTEDAPEQFGDAVLLRVLAAVERTADAVQRLVELAEQEWEEELSST